MTILLLTSCTPIDQGWSEVYFCPETNCASVLIDFINLANHTLDCALFNVNDPSVVSALKNSKAQVRIFTDSDSGIPGSRYDYKRSLMHNKFCIADNKIILTGSYNPTSRGITSYNDIIIIKSEHLVKNYAAEFEELWGRKPHSKVKYPKVYVNDFLFENYFCPEDHCEDNLVYQLNQAKDNIYFMTYCFTAERVTKTLINLSQEINIIGIMDSTRSKMPYNRFNDLRENNINVIQDCFPAIFHHKVFIIDNKTVITGSYNPTINGNKNNDENMLIIHDPIIAEKYVEYFYRIYNQCSP